jgi:ferredoxin
MSLEEFKDRNVGTQNYRMLDLGESPKSGMEKFKQVVERSVKLELFTGLKVTFREMYKALFKKNMHTVKYPFEKMPIAPRYRAIHEMKRLLESGHYRCIGCGLCEKVCILEETAIRVLPVRLAKGELGKHYRLGWERSGRDGKEFPTADPEHVYRLPEGLSYEHSGRGLMGKGVGPKTARPAITAPGTQMKKTPFSSNPLDTLNRGLKGAK